MAKPEIFIDTHLDLSFSPLTITSGISVEGGVADMQSFDQSNSQYTPDYTSTYLVLKSWMRIADPDGIIADGLVQMTNMHWYVVNSGVETEISNGTDYQMDTNGRLSVRKNVDPGKSRLFRFKGEYQDPRTGEVYTMEETHSVSCEPVSATVNLFLNFPPLTEWDPTNATDDPSIVKLTADLRIGNTSVPAANRELIWEKKDKSDTDFCRIYRPGDANYDVRDYDVEISTDGTQLTLNRNLMGEEVAIRVRAKYDPYGNPSGITLTDRSPKAEARFVRALPVPTVRTLTPQRFNPTQKNFSPEAMFYIGRREITNPTEFWSINWYLSKGVAGGTVSRTLVATGVKPTIPTTNIAQAYGATLQPGIKEKDPLSCIKVTENTILVDDQGRIILA